MFPNSTMTSNGLLCPAMEPSYSHSSEEESMQSPFNYADYPDYADLYSSSPAQELDFPPSQPPFNSFYDFSSSPDPYALPDMDMSPVANSYAIPIPCPQPQQPQFYDPSPPPSLLTSATSSFSPPLQWSFDESPISCFSLGVGVGDSPPETSKSPKPFPCTDCGKAFARSADLKRHQTSVHYPVFQDCPVQECSRKGHNGFPRRDHMVEHMRSYHHMPVPKRGESKRLAKGQCS